MSQIATDNTSMENTRAFVALYILFGILAVLPYVGLALVWNHVPSKVKTDLRQVQAKVHAAEIRAAGDQNLAAMCEANITQQVQSAYGQVTKPYRLISVKQGPKPDEVKVTVLLISSVYSGNLTCTMHKSNWNIEQVAPSS